jgi:hypothetical protein
MAQVSSRSSERNYPDRTGYMLAELRCASLRARLWQSDIDAVGLALRGGLITAQQAAEMLADCDALHLVEGVRPEAAT